MGNGQRVLICEDDCAIRGLLDKLLSRHGLAVDSVAVAAVLRKPFDLLEFDAIVETVLSRAEVRA